MAAWRALRLADTLNALRLKELVPLLEIAHVERDVREPDAVPGDGARRDLRLERKDFEHGASRHADPADLATAAIGVDPKEGPHPVRRRIRDTNQRTPEDLPVELHRAVEVGNGDAAVAERARLRRYVSLM